MGLVSNPRTDVPPECRPFGAQKDHPHWECPSPFLVSPGVEAITKQDQLPRVPLRGPSHCPILPFLRLPPNG